MRTMESVYRDSSLIPYLKQIDTTPLLSAEEEQNLSALVAGGDPHARKHMVSANLRLVVSIARNYRNRGLSMEDLIGEGNLGLLQAVDKFDRNVGVRFSTYASYLIKQTIRAALINQVRHIRLPVYMVGLIVKWRRAESALVKELGRPPLPEEVGAALGLSKKTTDMVCAALHVNDLQQSAQDRDYSSNGIFDTLADERSLSASETFVLAEERGRINEKLGRLSTREDSIISMRFGLGPNSPMTLREIAKKLNLSRERVRQLEKGALYKLAQGVS